MFTLLVVAICARLTTFFLTPFVRDFFGFLQFVDKPDFDRKVHARPIPRVGGIPLGITYLFSVGILVLIWWQGLIDLRDPSIRLMIRLSPAVALIFAVGLFDDFRGLSPLQKLACELVAATYACAIGVRLATPPGSSMILVVTVAVMSVLWLVLCANAINLIDGLDGLATGVALLASVSLLMAAMIHHRPGLALVMAPFIGCLFGFLYYNFNPASIFLGDAGSLLVGFLLGCYGLMWHQQATTGLGMAAPLVALAFPLGEVMLSIARRFLRNTPIFGADRNHIHHRLLRRGLSHRGVALVLYGVSALTALLAFLQTILHPRMATVLLVLLITVAYIGFRALEYSEFGVLGNLLFSGEFRRLLRVKIHLKEYEQSLASARTVDECWLALRNTCREAKFSYVALRVNGQFFEDEPKTPHTGEGERLQVQLSSSDIAIFRHDPDMPELAMLMAPVVESLRKKLRFNQDLQDVNSPEEIAVLAS